MMNHGTRMHIKWDRVIGMLIMCAMVFLMVLSGLLTATREEPKGQDTFDPTLLPACETEDSDNCYWDGDIRGNRSGISFYTLDDETTIITELPRCTDAIADARGMCWGEPE